MSVIEELLQPYPITMQIPVYWGEWTLRGKGCWFLLVGVGCYDYRTDQKVPRTPEMRERLLALQPEVPVQASD